MSIISKVKWFLFEKLSLWVEVTYRDEGKPQRMKLYPGDTLNLLGGKSGKIERKD